MAEHIMEGEGFDRRQILAGALATLFVSAAGAKLVAPPNKPALLANGWPILNGQELSHAEFSDLGSWITRYFPAHYAVSKKTFRTPIMPEAHPNNQIVYAICPRTEGGRMIGDTVAFFVGEHR